MISHGVEISIAGGGADEKDERGRGLFFFIFIFIFYIIYSLLRYKKSHGALAMAKTKPKIQNKQTKETSGTKFSSTGVRTGPRPTYGREIQASTSKETLPQPAESMKNNKANLALLRRHKVTKGNYIRRAGRNSRHGGRRAREHTRGKGCGC